MGRKPLVYGEDTIDDLPYRGRGSRIIDLPDGRRKFTFRINTGNGTVQRRIFAPAGTSDAKVYRMAHEKAKSMLKEANVTGAWKPNQRIDDYVTKEVIPRIRAMERTDGPKRQGKLAPSSVKAYATDLTNLAKEFGPTPIGRCTPHVVEEALLAMAQEHGLTAANRAKKCAGRYVFAELVKEGTIERSPIDGLVVQWPDPRDIVRKKKNDVLHGKAIPASDYERLIRWLAEADPVARRPDGSVNRRSTPKRARAIQLARVQAATGLRVSEALSLTKADVIETKNGHLMVLVRDERCKTGKGRVVPVIDDGVADLIRSIAGSLEHPTDLILPEPTDTTHTMPWDENNAIKAIHASVSGKAQHRRGIFDEAADELGIPMLHDVATHVWRVTLSSVLRARGVSESVCSELFGHSEEVHKTYYTDLKDIEAMDTIIWGDNGH